MVAWDDNGDGVLDLLVTDVSEPAHLFLSQGCTQAAWIEIDAPHGSRVEVWAAGQVRTGWVSVESGYAGAGTGILHMGLGSQEALDEVTVTTVDGEQRTWSEVSARQVLHF